MKKIIIIAAALILSACAGVPFSWDNARQVKVGMTTAEVNELMGRPYLVASMSDGRERWNWTFATGLGSMKTYNAFIKDGKVVEVPRIPDGDNFR